MSRLIDKVGYRVIRDLSFENFLNFKQFNAEFAGINLIVGENDTGKTGLLKLLYAISKTWEIYSRQQSRSAFKKVLGQKLFDTFQPNGIGDLVTKAAKEKFKLNINFAYESVAQEIRFGFGESTKNTINECTDHVKSVGELITST
jgi:AAA15 family ATPase/GTPase